MSRNSNFAAVNRLTPEFCQVGGVEARFTSSVISGSQRRGQRTSPDQCEWAAACAPSTILVFVLRNPGNVAVRMRALDYSEEGHGRLGGG
ncbi:MAG TPA: hypothetical protein VJQ57_10845 [Acidimicrobiia bacterium]|nr:hypothetical protein [Acidimicrobiia bacterium]